MDLFNEPTENYKTGYIKLYRSVMEHQLFKTREPFSRLEAWIDILSQVNHKPSKITIKNVVVFIDRGDSLNSLDTWGKRWNWNKSKVRRFLELLFKENMIRLKSEQISTRLTVCNYDTYQNYGNTDETQLKRKRNASETQMTPNNNDKNVNNENKGIYRAFKHLKISNEDVSKLIEIGYSKKQVDDMIDSVQNYKKNSAYDSLYLTLRKWLKKEYPKVEEVEQIEESDFLSHL